MKRIIALILAILCIALISCDEAQNTLTLGTPTSVATNEPQTPETTPTENTPTETAPVVTFTPEPTETDNTIDPIPDPTTAGKGYLHISWYFFETLEDLFDGCYYTSTELAGGVNTVFEGVLKDVSFDPQAHFPDHDGINTVLRTNYEIEVTKVYYGDVVDTCSVSCDEGYLGYKEDIQFEILGEKFLEKYEPQLVHTDNMFQPKIGEKYLFIAKQDPETGKYKAVTPYQFAYVIDPEERLPEGGVKKSTRPSYKTIIEYVRLLEYVDKGVIPSIPE